MLLKFPLKYWCEVNFFFFFINRSSLYLPWALGSAKIDYCFSPPRHPAELKALHALAQHCGAASSPFPSISCFSNILPPNSCIWKPFMWCSHLLLCKFSMCYISFSVGLIMKLVNKHSFTSLFPSLFSACSLACYLIKGNPFALKRAPSLMLDVKLPWYRVPIRKQSYQDSHIVSTHLYSDILKGDRISQWDRNMRVSIIIGSPKDPQSYKWIDPSHKIMQKYAVS